MKVKIIQIVGSPVSLIGEQTDKNTFKHVFMIHAIQEDKDYRLRFIPYVPYSNTPYITFNPQHVIAVLDPLDEIKDAYKQTLQPSKIIKPDQAPIINPTL